MKYKIIIPLVLAVSAVGCIRHTPSPFSGVRVSPVNAVLRQSKSKEASKPPIFVSAACNRVYDSIFSSIFTMGGIGQDGYAAGEWTSWKLTDRRGRDVSITEMAFLKEAGSGAEWWRFGYTPPKGDRMLFEALIDRSDFSTKKLRAQMSPGDEIYEIPVKDKSPRPGLVTPESLKASAAAKEKVTVPAGRFNSSRALHSTDDGVMEVWLNDTVPGGVVKYRFSASDGDSLKGELASYGSGAVSLLGSY